MVTVALVGATTGFGLTMLHTFLHLNKDNQQHKIVLLSRSEQPHFTAQGIDVRPVDYTNHAQLVQSLQGVHTVLSLIGGNGLSAQLALLEASKAAGVKRFAPSEYAGNDYKGIDLYAPKAEVWEAVKNSGLEYTRFACGLFMSALATGTPKPPTEVGIREGAKTGEEEALSGLRPWNFVLNITAGTADFAGDGTGLITFTDMRDIARFVWRALELKEWPEQLGMRGDVKSFREVISMLEGVSGRKNLIRANSIRDLEDEAARDSSKQFYNQARIAAQNGGLHVSDELNQAFPDEKTVTCEEFIEKWWSGVRLGEPAWSEAKIFGADNL